MSRGEEYFTASSVFADIEVYRHVELVGLVRHRLATPGFIADCRTHIRDLDHDGLPKGTRVRWRERILVPRKRKAPSTDVTRPESWNRPKGELADSRTKPRRGDPTRRLRAPAVHREARISRARTLHVSARRRPGMHQRAADAEKRARKDNRAAE